jgi:hypothetical protein
MNDVSLCNLCTFSFHCDPTTTYAVHDDEQHQPVRAGVFSLNTAGSNRFYFQPHVPPSSFSTAPGAGAAATTKRQLQQSEDEHDKRLMDSLHEWLSAIRLSVFEETLLSKVFTDVLIHQRLDYRQLEAAVIYGTGGSSTKMPSNWNVNSVHMEGYLQVCVHSFIHSFVYKYI